MKKLILVTALCVLGTQVFAKTIIESNKLENEETKPTLRIVDTIIAAQPAYILLIKKIGSTARKTIEVIEEYEAGEEKSSELEEVLITDQKKILINLVKRLLKIAVGQHKLILPLISESVGEEGNLTRFFGFEEDEVIEQFVQDVTDFEMLKIVAIEIAQVCANLDNKENLREAYPKFLEWNEARKETLKAKRAK